MTAERDDRNPFIDLDDDYDKTLAALNKGEKLPEPKPQRPTPTLVIGAAMIAAVLLDEASHIWDTVHSLNPVLFLMILIAASRWARVQ